MNRIREIREQRASVVASAFTLTAVARRIGVAEKTVARWEQGLSRPHARHARRLAKELGVSVDDLGLDEAVPEDDGDREDPDHDEAEPGR